MGQNVEKGFKRVIAHHKSFENPEAGLRKSSGISPEMRRKGDSPRKGGSKGSGSSVDSGIGLRPFKVTHSDEPNLRMFTILSDVYVFRRLKHVQPFAKHCSSFLIARQDLQQV